MKIIVTVFLSILSILLLVDRCTAQDRGYPMSSIDLLDKRLTVQMPEGSSIEAIRQGVMSAPESDRSETRVIFDDGQKRLVLMAWEIFKTAGEKFEEKVQANLKILEENEKTEFTVRKIREDLIIGIPDKYNIEDEAILYVIAYIRNFDNTVQYLTVYFNNEFHKESTIAKSLAEKILESIKPGSRKLDTAKGVKIFPIYSKQYRLTIDFPDNFYDITDKGPDFLVHWIREVVEFGTIGKSIGIYVGNHPGYEHKEYEPGKLKIEKVDKELFGKKCTWIKYAPLDSVDEFRAETIIGTGIPNLDVMDFVFHFFCFSSTREGLDDILKILETAKIIELSESDVEKK